MRLKVKNCYNCNNFNQAKKICECLTYAQVGVTLPDCYPNGCKYHNVNVLVPMNNCKDDVTITDKNYKKCIGCVHDCIRKGKDPMKETRWKLEKEEK